MPSLNYSALPAAADVNTLLQAGGFVVTRAGNEQGWGVEVTKTPLRGCRRPPPPPPCSLNTLGGRAGFSLPLPPSPSPLSATTDAVSLVFAGEALAAVSQFVLTLDLPTLARILNGDIQT